MDDSEWQEPAGFPFYSLLDDEAIAALDAAWAAHLADAPFPLAHAAEASHRVSLSESEPEELPPSRATTPASRPAPAPLSRTSRALPPEPEGEPDGTLISASAQSSSGPAQVHVSVQVGRGGRRSRRPRWLVPQAWGPGLSEAVSTDGGTADAPPQPPRSSEARARGVSTTGAASRSSEPAPAAARQLPLPEAAQRAPSRVETPAAARLVTRAEWCGLGARAVLSGRRLWVPKSPPLPPGAPAKRHWVIVRPALRLQGAERGPAEGLVVGVYSSAAPYVEDRPGVLCDSAVFHGFGTAEEARAYWRAAKGEPPLPELAVGELSRRP